MSDRKSIARNRRAYHDYEILETYEAGIMLTGTEIKSVREGNVSLKGSYVTLRLAESVASGHSKGRQARLAQGRPPQSIVLLTNTHIGPYKPAGENQHDPTRSRRLLLKKSEIKRLIGVLQTKGLTAIPLEVYLKGRWAKVSIGVGRGKKLYDKRASIKEREVNLRMKRAVGRRG